MKILNIKSILLAAVIVLTLSISSEAGIRFISMDSTLLENQSQDATVDFFVNSQQQSDLADIHSNCAENPQEPGGEFYDPITRLEKKLVGDWDDWSSPSNSGTPTQAALFFASTPGSSDTSGTNDTFRTDDTSSNDFDTEKETDVPDESTDTPVTPEPATLLIISSALAAIPVVRRYREQKNGR